MNEEERLAAPNGGQGIEDHFGEITEMVESDARGPPVRREHQVTEIQETQTTKGPEAAAQGDGHRR